MEGGTIVFHSKEDAEEQREYENVIKNMDLETYRALIGSNSTNKSFEKMKYTARMKLTISYHIEWLFDLYKRILMDSSNSIPGLDDAQVNWLTDAIQKNKLWEVYEKYNRIEIAYFMMVLVGVVHRNCVSCVVFSNKSSAKSKNYAYLYVYHSSKPEASFFCIGPNMTSSDGEYRKKFCAIASLRKTQITHHRLWKDVEEYLETKPNLGLNTTIYSFTDDKKMNDALKSMIDVHRYQIKLLVASWLSQIYPKFHNLQNSNAKGSEFNAEDMRFIAYLVETYGHQHIKQFYWDIGVSLSNYQPRHILKQPLMGQKIVPLSKHELKNTWDTDYGVWREYYIARKASDLVINMICPGVPIMHDMFYIHGVDDKLFNNENVINMINKVKRDENMANTENNDTSELIMKDVSGKAIVMLSEHMGRTVNGIAVAMESEEYQHRIGSLFTKDEFHKYCFDITYALLCLNTKLQVIHCDLHLNNTCVYHEHRDYLFPAKKSGSVYVFEDTMFMFKSMKTGTVIDFGRSMVLDDVTDTASARQQYSDTIKRYYTIMFPDFDQRVLDAALARFDQAYKVFMAIDMFMHTERLKKYLGKHRLHEHKSVPSLINTINKMCKTYLINGMMDVAKGKSVAVNPNYAILMKCFSSYMVDKTKTPSMSRVFFYPNALKYSFDQKKFMHPRFSIKLKKPGDPNTIGFPPNPLDKAINQYLNVKAAETKF